MIEYVPLNPYEFKGKKKAGTFDGKCLEAMMFQDYPELKRYYLKYFKPETDNKNRLQKHLEWLFTRGKSRVAKVKCPYCKQKPITQFSILWSEFGCSMGMHFSCCNNPVCKDAVIGQAAGKSPTFLPANFKSILWFSSKADQHMFTKLLQMVFGLSRLDRQKVFDFFKAENEPPKRYDMFDFMICYDDCRDCAHRYQNLDWCPKSDPDENHTISEDSIHCLGHESVSS